ncbi:hypothetical protein Trco_000751 [Trichoderma cornu-damae]|uniref:Uncharacterized protein n=1 Tax=Trichoderma cornu-damae TaxID=654480 RepID=A0A9P8TWM2_9HYPO|nr:hypothetical protein Trco_000751 [Trichoderma cornu-damae]
MTLAHQLVTAGWALVTYGSPSDGCKEDGHAEADADADDDDPQPTSPRVMLVTNWATLAKTRASTPAPTSSSSTADDERESAGDKGPEGDAEAGCETEDGLEHDLSALGCHGEECKLAAVASTAFIRAEDEVNGEDGAQKQIFAERYAQQLLGLVDVGSKMENQHSLFGEGHGVVFLDYLV